MDYIECGPSANTPAEALRLSQLQHNAAAYEMQGSQPGADACTADDDDDDMWVNDAPPLMSNELSDRQLLQDVLNGLVELSLSHAGGEMGALLTMTGRPWNGVRWVMSFTSDVPITQAEQGL